MLSLKQYFDRILTIFTAQFGNRNVKIFLYLDIETKKNVEKLVKANNNLITMKTIKKKNQQWLLSFLSQLSVLS